MEGKRLLLFIFLFVSLTAYSKKDSIKNKDYSLAVTEVNGLSYVHTLFEVKENKIATQQEDVALLNKDNQQLFIFGGIGLFFIFLIIILYRKRSQLKKDKKLQEVYFRQLLISQEKDRQLISKDLHDGLENNLLILKNKLVDEKDPEIETLLSNSIEGIRNISRVLYPYQLDDIGFSRSLENLISQLDESYKDTSIHGEIENIDTKIDSLQSLNIYRIVQECLSNIVKHANAISAEVNVFSKNNTVHIHIKDNGKGFNFSEKYTTFKTMGLKTILERVKFLDGSLQIESKQDKGTHFLIEFSI